MEDFTTHKFVNGKSSQIGYVVSFDIGDFRLIML